MKKVPVRKCVACNERKSKYELIRIVQGEDGSLTIDESGKANGRGAYLCKDPTCILKAKKTGRLKMSLKAEVPEDFYEELMNYVEE